MIKYVFSIYDCESINRSWEDTHLEQFVSRFLCHRKDLGRARNRFDKHHFYGYAIRSFSAKNLAFSSKVRDSFSGTSTGFFVTRISFSAEYTASLPRSSIS